MFIFKCNFLLNYSVTDNKLSWQRTRSFLYGGSLQSCEDGDAWYYEYCTHAQMIESRNILICSLCRVSWSCGDIQGRKYYAHAQIQERTGHKLTRSMRLWCDQHACISWGAPLRSWSARACVYICMCMYACMMKLWVSSSVSMRGDVFHLYQLLHACICIYVCR